MKKLTLGLMLGICIAIPALSQNLMEKYKGKTFIFDGSVIGIECDQIGNQSGGSQILIKGSLFSVETITKDSSLVIKFLVWKETKDSISKTYREKYNFITPMEKAKRGSTDNKKYFLVSKNTFNSFCSEYVKFDKYYASIGTLTTPFKLRYKPAIFQTNLNLGTSLLLGRRWKNSFTFGGILGLSLTQIVLDSFSTRGKTKVNTERPALTPSFSFMIGYKNMNAIIGIGWDFINRNSPLEGSWIYRGQRWFGIGFGISLFNSTDDKSKSTTETTEKQKE